MLLELDEKMKKVEDCGKTVSLEEVKTAMVEESEAPRVAFSNDPAVLAEITSGQMVVPPECPMSAMRSLSIASWLRRKASPTATS